MPLALRLCALTGAGDDTRAAAYYSALLVNAGCHTDAYEQPQYAEAASKLSEMARMLRLPGSGATPLHRIRVAFGGHKQVAETRLARPFKTLERDRHWRRHEAPRMPGNLVAQLFSNTGRSPARPTQPHTPDELTASTT